MEEVENLHVVALVQVDDPIAISEGHDVAGPRPLDTLSGVGELREEAQGAADVEPQPVSRDGVALA